MKTLEKVHASLHETLKRIVPLKQNCRPAEAEAGYRKIGPISGEIIDLLTVIENKVAAMQ